MNPTSKIYLAGLIVILIVVINMRLSAQSHPDNVYPIPDNFGDVGPASINLFTGEVNHPVTLHSIAGRHLTYDLTIFYNSRSAAIGYHSPNVLGDGYGWKLMDYPKVVNDNGRYYLLDGYAALPMQLADNNTYVTGRDYALWKLQRNTSANSWEIIDESGVRYLLANTSADNGYTFWHLSQMITMNWQDTLFFEYDQDRITTISNLLNEEIQLQYEDGLLSVVEYHDNVPSGGQGRVRDQITLSYNHEYNRYNGKVLLESVKGLTVLRDGSLTDYAADLEFVYNEPDSLNPLSLYQIIFPQGASLSYSYYNGSDFEGTRLHPVVEYRIDDAFDNTSEQDMAGAAIFYDPGRWQWDPTDIYGHFNVIKVYPGGSYQSSFSDISDPFGHQTYYYFNGLPAYILEGLPAGYDTVDVESHAFLGLSYKTMTFDKQEENERSLVSSQTSQFEIVGHPGIDFARLTLQKTALDSVMTQTSYTYVENSLLPKSILSERSNPKHSEGDVFHQDSVKILLTYAFEIYDDLGPDGLHLLSPTIQRSTLVKEYGEGQWRVTSGSAATWKNWGTPKKPAWAGSSAYILQAEIPESDLLSVFEGTPSRHWLKVKIIKEREVFGDVKKEKDPTTGLISSTLYDTVYQIYPVVQFTHADATQGQAGYLGFEGYEPVSLWTYTGGQVVLDTVHTGNRAYMQDNGHFSVSPKVYTPREDVPYLLSAYVKLLAGGSCTIGYQTNGSWTESSLVTYDSNGGDWQQIQIINSTASKTEIPLLSCNNALTDDIYFMPADATFNASVYQDLSAGDDMLTIMPGTTGTYSANFTIEVANNYQLTSGHLNLTAGDNIIIDGEVLIEGGSLKASIADFSMEMDKTLAVLSANDQVLEVVYNGIDQSVAVVDQQGRPRRLSLNYHSRLGSTFFDGNDEFNSKQPNQTLQIASQADGVWEDFSSENTPNFPPADLSGMRIENHSLITRSALNHQQASAVFAQKLSNKDAAIYVELTVPESDNNKKSPETGIAIGEGKDEIRFVINNDSYTLYNKGTGEVYASVDLHTLPRFTALVLTVINGDCLFAYADGRFLFNYKYARGITGEVRLISDIPGAFFNNFIYIEEPVMTKRTFDGEIDLRQSLAQNGPDELYATERLYGTALDLPMAQIRPVALKQPSVLQPVEGFAEFQQEELKLSGGKAKDAYNNGRPFSASDTYDQDPLAREASSGTGGPFTANKNATQFGYDDNGDAFFNFKEEELNVTRTIEPDQLEIQRFRNESGDLMARLWTRDGQTLQQQFEYDIAMRQTRNYTPNVYSSIEDAFKYCDHWGYNFLGQTTLKETTDGGTDWYAWDDAGRQRLAMDANGRDAENPYFVYSKYDARHRLLEKGLYFPSKEDQGNLMDLKIPADTTSGSYTAINTIQLTSGTASGDLVLKAGNSISFSGEIVIENTALVAHILANAAEQQLADSLAKADFPVAGTARVTWHYDTDDSKKNNSQTIGRLAGAEFFNVGTTEPATESYKYDADGNIVVVKKQWPDAGGFQVEFKYTYNLHNQVTRVRDIGPYSTGYDVTYSYDDLGRLVAIGVPGNRDQYASYTYGNGKTTETLNDGTFKRVYTTNMAGWTESITDSLFEEKLYYQKRKGGGEGYYSGQISSIENKFKWSGAPENYTWQHSYDPFHRLSASLNDHHEQYNVGKSKPIAYDPNGNIQLIETGANTYNYKYYPGTNQLRNTDLTGKIAYDLNGRITATDGYTFSYDTLLDKVTTIRRPGDATISYQYTANGERISKKVGDTMINYAHGLNDYPLLEWEITGQDTTVVQYVYGAGGLVAFKRGALEPVATTYLATLEPKHHEEEALDFAPSYDQVSKVSATLFNHTNEADANTSMRLDGSHDRVIGLAKSLKVSIGDTVRIEVFAKYPLPDKAAPHNEVAGLIASAFTTAFGVGAVGEVRPVYAQPHEPFNAGVLTGDGEEQEVPHGYLNYILFDRTFNPTQSGYQRITEAALEDGTCGGLKGCQAEKLTLEVPVTKTGYLYTWVSNESQRQYDVHFDDMKVVHIQTPSWNYVLKDHLGSVRVVADANNEAVAWFNYLPFGDDMDSLSDDGGTGLRYLYTGQEFEPETGLYNYRARLYHPVLGRFYSPDPLGQQFSAYAYAGNNPILYTDPTGMFSWKNLGMGLLGGAEILVGLALEAAGTAADATGVGAAVGVGLNVLGASVMGAGVTTTIDVVTSSLSGDELSGKQLLLSQLWGAATGVVDFGIGKAAGGLVTKIVGETSSVVGQSVNSVIARGVASGAVSGAVAGAVSGAGSSVVTQVANNLSGGLKWSTGVGRAAVLGAGIGAVGGAVIGGFGGGKKAMIRHGELLDQEITLMTLRANEAQRLARQTRIEGYLLLNELEDIERRTRTLEGLVQEIDHMLWER